MQLGTINTREVWKFYQIVLAQAARQILANFPNITYAINPQLSSLSHGYVCVLMHYASHSEYELQF